MKTIIVRASKTYQVQIGHGLITNLGAQIASLRRVKKVCIVSDTNVWPLWGRKVARPMCNAGFSVYHYLIPAGEDSKNSENFLDLINYLAKIELTRTDVIVALGGGVVGDLAGFAAACFLRGIRFVQIPTTLLAMVDSSVGGKTAINLPAGKNLCGAFYQPSLVLCDTNMLNTLPEDIFRDGCAEVIKYGVLYDQKLFSHLQEKGLAFDREMVIHSCIQWKRDVVEADEFDNSLRMKLNFGHTVGHGVEAGSHFSLSHGKAVAIGMAIVTRASVKRRYCSVEACSALLDLLNAFGLPSSTEFSAEELYRYSLSDKKRTDNTVNLVVPIRISDCAILPLPIAELTAFIQDGL